MLFDRTHVLLKDDRRDLRIRENTQVPWQIKYKQRHGLARIRNISAGGMLIETDRAFDLKDECVFSFDSEEGDDTYIPQVGRLVWHKRKKFSRNRYLCGIKFVEADEKVLQRMRLRVARGVRQFVREKNVTAVVGLAMAAIFAGLMGFIIVFGSVIYRDITQSNETALLMANQQAMLAQNTYNLYRSSEIKLAEASEKLVVASRLIQEDKAAIDLFSKELEATKALLAQTESMLIAANDRNVDITNQLQALQGPGAAQAQASQGVVLAQPIGDGSIDSADEARVIMAEYRSRVNSIRGELKRLLRQEQSTRAANIDMLDQQRLEIGNNGYLIRNGEGVKVDAARYNSLTIDNLTAAGVGQTNQNAEINIQFID